jgi:tripartite-type tricarboxylate transporter receptor subunit TctC
MKPIFLVLISAMSLAFVSTADAQTWPAKPLRAIVPFGAGSTTDIIPRVVFEQLSSQLGHAIIVENRSGAGGTIGAGFVAKAEPDGYTLLANSNAHTIAPSLIRTSVTIRRVILPP